MSHCMHCGKLILPGDRFCGGCGSAVDGCAPAVVAPMAAAVGARIGDTEEQTLRRIADYERISAILWICLGVVQVLMVATIIAGAWNIYAGWLRLRLPELIRERHHEVPDIFEDITSLVIIGILNLVLGGVVGIAFVVFDLVIRDMVLRNRHLFTEGDAA